MNKPQRGIPFTNDCVVVLVNEKYIRMVKGQERTNAITVGPRHFLKFPGAPMQFPNGQAGFIVLEGHTITPDPRQHAKTGFYRRISFHQFKLHVERHCVDSEISEQVDTGLEDISIIKVSLLGRLKIEHWAFLFGVGVLLAGLITMAQKLSGMGG